MSERDKLPALIDLTGSVYGMLTVIERAPNQDGRTSWLCSCECGNTAIVKSEHLKGSYTKSCGCAHHLLGYKSPKWSGFQGIPGEYWTRVQHNARKRNIDFDLTVEYIWDLLLRQNCKCARTGRDLSFGLGRSARSDTTASLDRIDSSIGYSVGNVQWVHKRYNQAKNNSSDASMVELARDIIRTYELNGGSQ